MKLPVFTCVVTLSISLKVAELDTTGLLHPEGWRHIYVALTLS